MNSLTCMSLLEKQEPFWWQMRSFQIELGVLTTYVFSTVTEDVEDRNPQKVQADAQLPFLVSFLGVKQEVLSAFLENRR